MYICITVLLFWQYNIYLYYYCIVLLLLGEGEVAITLHVLGLLADILGTFPHNSLKATCETILRVMTLANVVSKIDCSQQS